MENTLHLKREDGENFQRQHNRLRVYDVCHVAQQLKRVRKKLLTASLIHLKINDMTPEQEKTIRVKLAETDAFNYNVYFGQHNRNSITFDAALDEIMTLIKEALSTQKEEMTKENELLVKKLYVELVRQRNNEFEHYGNFQYAPIEMQDARNVLALTEVRAIINEI